MYVQIHMHTRNCSLNRIIYVYIHICVVHSIYLYCENVCIYIYTCLYVDTCLNMSTLIAHYGLYIYIYEVHVWSRSTGSGTASIFLQGINKTF